MGEKKEEGGGENPLKLRKMVMSLWKTRGIISSYCLTTNSFAFLSSGGASPERCKLSQWLGLGLAWGDAGRD